MKHHHLLVAAFCMFAAPLSFANDGLVIQFTISEQVDGSNQKSTYTNAVLMKFDEEASFDLHDAYVVKVKSRPDIDETVDLLVTLKDLVNGKPYYVGAKSLTLKIGKSANLEFSKYDKTYSISLDTSYGKLP